MYTYNKPYRVAFIDFLDKYLILYIGIIVSVIGISIQIINRNLHESLNIFLIASMITVVLFFIFWYWMGYKRIKGFTINIVDNRLEICDQKIMPSEIKEAYTTKNNDLVVITNINSKYKIFKSLIKFDEFIFKVKNVTTIQSKSERKGKIVYAINLFIFIIFMLVNIPYIVIPLGIYLILTYAIETIRKILYKTEKIILIISINFLMVCFIGFKLLLHLRFLIMS